MKLTVEAFAIARQKLGFRSREVDWDVASVEDVLKRLCEEHPEQELIIRACRCAVDGEYASLETPVREGSEFSIIPPVSGGTSEVAVSEDPIDLGEALSAVSSESCGAVVFFVGTVRDRNDGHDVTSIEYEAKTSMAVSELEVLIEQARRKFGIEKAFIRHRIGPVPVGEASVVISVSSPHRKESYEANAWLLDELKKVAPIWKHEERLVDGKTEKVWLQGGG